jgi:hypothetical protein
MSQCAAPNGAHESHRQVPIVTARPKELRRVVVRVNRFAGALGSITAAGRNQDNCLPGTTRGGCFP